MLTRTIPAAADLEETRAKITAQLAAAGTELANLVEGLAKSGTSPAVTAAIRTREALKLQFEYDLANLDRREQLSQIEVSRLEALARAKASEWRSLLKRHTPQARQILSKMLRDKLVFVPEPHGRQRGWRFTGEATLTELLTGLIPEFSQAVASPTGTANSCNVRFTGVAA